MADTEKQLALPPGWEAVPTAGEKVYYWNKKTGATTWKFPEEEAKEHLGKLKRHNYENMVKNPATSTGPAAGLVKTTPPPLVLQAALAKSEQQQQKKFSSPVKTGSTHISSSTRKGYENVQFCPPQSSQKSLSSPPPHYEDVNGTTSTHDQPSSRPRVASLTSSSSEPLSPSPPLPDRKYSDSDMFSTANKLGRVTTNGEESENKRRGTLSSQSSASEVVKVPQHEVSETGCEYAIVERQARRANDSSAESAVAPKLPLRAHQRIILEEDKAQQGQEKGVAEEKNETESKHHPLKPLVSNELEMSREMSPQPYEVASPTVLHPPAGDPHYEEIVQDTHKPAADNGCHYVEVDHTRMSRPRGFSSPLSPSSSLSSGVESSSSRERSSTVVSPDNVLGSQYDLPLNSRKLQSLNVTLRREDKSNGMAGDYAKLDRSKEALLLRSGVTLRRHDRESLSSMLSFTSYLDEFTGGGGDMENSSDKCTRGLESSLTASDSVDEFKMVIPPPASPSWLSFKRRPHAYEDIMGASQEELDWDETDMGVSPRLEIAVKEKDNSGDVCEMVKVSEDSPKLLSKVRVVHHQYEDVQEPKELQHSQQQGKEGDTGTGHTVRESWVEGEGDTAGLPRGWQLMRDEQQREYYWHIPTGRTQYSPPTPTRGVPPTSPSALPLKSSPGQLLPATYLGWLPVAPEELVAGQCVKAVHSCITKKMGSLAGDTSKGEAVLLEVKGLELRWLHPETSTPITTQPINRIRVWGIGLEDERDFGYVSRDLATQKHRCHIFRCGMPARAVAQVLLESHQQERENRRKRRSQPSSKQQSHSASSLASQSRGTQHHTHSQQHEQESRRNSSGPISGGLSRPGGHERYERINCVYIGWCEVGRGQGMEAINEAVERLSKEPAHQRQEVAVDVAISSITIADLKSGCVLHEHRIRYLCFLGIAKDDRYCGYILDNGERRGEKYFTFHGFYMEPNTDRLCLALHAACQARYKRVLEANQAPRTLTKPKSSGSVSSSSSSSLLGSLRKAKRADSKSFAVHYLGHSPVQKVEGLDTVRPVVQELAVTSKSNPAHQLLVELEIAPSGLVVRDAKTKSIKKSFPVHDITYVVKIREYFAFVAKEKGGQYTCHVFMEAKVDAGTVVTTIQRTLVPRSASATKSK